MERGLACVMRQGFRNENITQGMEMKIGSGSITHFLWIDVELLNY